MADLSVYAGRLIKDGSPFHLGYKDIPIHVSRDGYIRRLRWLSTKYVLLWDEGDKRGWLVNGTSALLHVVRAFLEYASRDKFRAAFLFKPHDLHEPANPFTADSAIEVLVDPKNLGLQIYPERDGFLLLQNQIEYFYNILEKLIDHQADIVGDGNANIADRPRKYLEGWDFNDLATESDPLHPRLAILEAGGKAWVDFARAIHAVTLVGRGFGEIIKPDVDFCEYWAELPKQKYYLAACLSDLGEITKKNKRYGDEFTKLSDDIIWHTPSALFGSCQCRGALGRAHCDPVQTLFPSSLSGILLPRKSPVSFDSRGAVIFGHNAAFQWVWGDTGHPEEGGLPTSSKSFDESSSNDSGIGTSLASPVPEFKPAPSKRTIIRNTMRSHSNSPTDTVSLGSAASVESGVHNRRQYTVGILCALPKELLAIRALFDRKHDRLGTALEDSNHYALGEMEQHMVVAACLPAGEYGTNSAADSASHMKRSFPGIRFCLLVGIGGGAPSKENDIRLGDVVVSSPIANFSGVIQYDMGKEKENCSFELTGSLQRPPRFLMSAISALRSDPDLTSDPLHKYLEIIRKFAPAYGHPGQENDELFTATCHRCQAQEECATRSSHIQQRDVRPTDEPTIHYGLIASGNRVIKDSQVRDDLVRRCGVLCFEMEAAGVMNTFPCLVIRGICDYADSYKNKKWQEYAAATAAAYAKLLLTVVVAKPRGDEAYQ